MTKTGKFSSRLAAAVIALALALSVFIGIDFTRAEAAATGFYVNGTTIYDANGNPFIIRGVNISHAWFTDKTQTSISAAASLGANTVRVVLANGEQWNKTSAEEVKNIIGWCKENQLVCVLEEHDATGRESTYDLNKAVDYWKEMKGLLSGNENFVILNIANEWYGPWNSDPWAEGYISAVKEIRSAGIKNMIMVDCAGWGQYPYCIKERGRDVFDADPDKNTVFSIHMYEYAGGNADMVKNNIDNALSINVPVVIGEFGGQHTDGDVDEYTIMSYCTEKNVGYMGWSWKGNNSDLAFLDIANDWEGTSLTEWGSTLFNDTYGIKKTSKKCTVFSGSPALTELPAVEGLKIGGTADNALRLNWNKHNSADGYIIEQFQNGEWVRIKKIAGSDTVTYRVASLASATEYNFRIKAYKSVNSNVIYSEYASVSGTTTGLAPVSGLKIGGTSYNALRLNWNKNDSADGYIIEQYTDGKWVRLKKLTSKETLTYRIASLTPVTNYKFRIKAYKLVNSEAVYSSYAEVSGTTELTAVKGLKIGGTADSAIRLNWNKNEYAAGYIVEQYKNGEWVRLKKIASNDTVSFRVTGLASATTYNFRVMSYKTVNSEVIYSAYVNISGKTN